MVNSLQLQRGLSLIELLICAMITALLLTIALPLGQDSYERSQLLAASDALDAAIHYAQNTAFLSNKALLLAPLDGQNWSSGLVLFADNPKHRRLEESISLYEWPWHFNHIKIGWQGFQSKDYLLFAPKLRHASANGRFTIASPHHQKILILNRLGHSHGLEKTY